MLAKLTITTLAALAVALVLMALEVNTDPRFSEEAFRNSTLELLTALQQQPLDPLHVTGTVASTVGALNTSATDITTKVVQTPASVPLGEIVVVDNDWRVLYDSTGITSAGKELPDIPGHLASYNGYQLAIPIRQNGHVAGYLLRSLTYQEVWGNPPLYNRLVSVRMFVAALVFMFLVYVSTFVLRRNFRRILTAIGQLAAGNLTARAHVTARDELGRLAGQLGDMAMNLQKAQEQEVELNRARDELVAGISHDLRTPLTSIIGYSQLLQEGAGNDTQLACYADIILQKAHRMQSLVDELLRYTKLRLGRLDARRELIDLGDLVAQCVLEYQPDFTQVGRTLALHRTSGQAVPVLADGELLRRVTDNLLVNALRHAEGATQVDVTVAMEAATTGQQQWAVVKVADNGAGIPPQEAPFVFQRFYHGQQNSDAAHPGSGLGLAVAHEIALLHSGTLSVSSELGHGTTFTLTMPIALASHSASA